MAATRLPSRQRSVSPIVDITVLLTKPGDVPPRRTNEFPVLKGTIRNARGHLGQFELAIDDYAQPSPSSRAKLVFGPSRNGATSTCDLILDLSGGIPLFPAHELRPGYLRADPRDKAAVERVIADAGGLVGTFDKPRFVNFEPSLCAHSRSSITGCTRCLDLCPTGAIVPNGDAVAIDANVCAGCGACASVCPTGAASYALPSADALMRRLRTLLQTYRKAGGSDAVVLFHDGEHGEDIIDALARFGEGLPANVLPLRVNEVTQLGPETPRVRLCLWRQRRRAAHPRQAPSRHHGAPPRGRNRGSRRWRAGFRCRHRSHRRDRRSGPAARHARCRPCGRRNVKAGRLRAARRASAACWKRLFVNFTSPPPRRSTSCRWRRARRSAAVKLNVEGCTLCHACVTACPTGALSDNPDRAMLRFTESLCVQCGLCEATCPEKVIAIEPRLDFQAWNAPLRVLKEEEPFNCIACGKPFGTKSSIDRVLAKLGEKHWMFQGANARRIDVIKMCADCRVEAVVNEGFDPHAGAATAAGHVDRRLSARARCKEGRSPWIVRSRPCPPPRQTSGPARRRKPPAFPASSMSSRSPPARAASASPPPRATSRSALPRSD